MTSSTTLRSLERQAWRTVHQDGLLDMYLGLVLVAFAGAMLLTRAGVTEIVTLMVHATVLFGGVALVWIGKRLITAPRIGTARFGSERRARHLKGRVVLAASALLGIAIWALFAWGPESVRSVGWPPYLFFANAVIVFGLLAFFLDLPRLGAYGLFFGLPILVRELLNGRDAKIAIVLFFGFGAAALIIGGALLAKFVRRYPTSGTPDA